MTPEPVPRLNCFGSQCGPSLSDPRRAPCRADRPAGVSGNRRPRGPLLRALPFAALAFALAGCAGSPSKEEEAAKNTVACLLNGERVVIRFDPGEARLLMPGGDRVTLYQITTASGIRYTNGLIEVRGKGMDLQFLRDGFSYALEECSPYVPPK